MDEPKGRAGGRRPSRWSLGAYGAGLALLAGLVGWRRIHRPVELADGAVSSRALPAVVDAGPTEDALRTARAAKACLELTDTDAAEPDWAAAIAACETAAKLDPGNDAPRRSLRIASFELGQKAIFEKVHAAFVASNGPPKPELLDALSGDSYYAASAHRDVLRAYAELQSRSGDACLELYDAGRLKKAWEACQEYGKATCVAPRIPEVQPVFDALAAQFGRGPAPVCDPRLS